MNQSVALPNPAVEGVSMTLLFYPELYDAYFYHSDHLGSSNYISNNTGIVSQHTEYLPFGETFVDEHLNSHNTPFKFNAKEFDDETGNYYYGARYYNPKWSTWLSVDPLVEETMQPYTAFNNNPVRYTDPTGMVWEDFQVALNLISKIGEKITNLGNKITKIEGKLSKEGITDRKRNRLENKKSNLEGRIESLNTSITDIMDIELADETFRLHKHGESSSRIQKGSDGVINIQGTTDGIFIHEIRHVAFSLNSEVGLVFNSDNILVPTTRDGLIDEMEGYKAQYAYSGGGLPFSISHISQLNYKNAKAQREFTIKIGSLQKNDGSPAYIGLYTRAQNQIKQDRYVRKVKRKSKKSK